MDVDDTQPQPQPATEADPGPEPEPEPTPEPAPEPAPESAPPAKGLFEQPLERSGKRERKKVERLETGPSTPVKKKTFDVASGSGEKIGDIEAICAAFEPKRSDDPGVVLLHRLLFGAAGKQTLRKRQIRSFCGWPEGTDTDKKSASLNKNATTVLLKSICSILCIDATKSTKDKLIEDIIDFCKKPSAPSVVPRASKPKKRKPAKKKSKKKGKKSKSVKAKRAPTAYILFATKHGRKIKEENPDMKQTDIMKKCGEAWKELPEDKRQPFIDESAGLKASLEASAPKKSTPKRKRKKKEVVESEESEAEDDDESEESDSDDSDDEPLIKKRKAFPTDSEIREEVANILTGADLSEMTVKKVRGAVKEKFPDFDLSEKKSFIKTCVTEFVNDS